MSLLKKDTIKKGQVNKLIKLKQEQELNTKNNMEYEVEPICDREVYTKKTADQLSGLY